MQSWCNAHTALACKLCRRHRGVRHCSFWHHKGYHRMAPAAGGAQQRTVSGIGGEQLA